MQNLKYRISILFIILIMCIIGWKNLSYGAYWDDNTSFTVYSGAVSSWNTSNRTFKRNYGWGGSYSIGYGVEILYARSSGMWEFNRDGTKPIIDREWGVVCTEHTTNIDGVLNDVEGKWPAIQTSIVVNGYDVYRNYDASGEMRFSSSQAIRAGRTYAYLGSLIGIYGPGPGGDHNTGIGQKAFWATCRDYLNSISVFPAVGSWINGSEVNSDTAKARPIINKAEDYANMPEKGISLTCENSVYKVAGSDTSKYIIGPFRANFSSYVGPKSGVRFSGEMAEKTTVNGETRNGGRWTFCDGSGNEISINQYSNGQPFFIKVSTSLLGKNGGRAELTLYSKERHIGAEWWELVTHSGNQGQAYFISSVKMWKEQSASAGMGAPTLTLRKEDYHTGKALAGMQFKIRTPYGYYVGTDKDGFPIYGSSSQARIFTSHSNGELDTIIMGMGTCWVEEISVGPNWQYEPGGSYQVEIGAGGNNPAIKNIRMYMNLSGYVWEDIEWADKSSFDSNELYRDSGRDTADKLLANVTVKLMQNGREVPFYDLRGNRLTEVKTDSSGRYLMHKVKIDDLTRNYIEFTYNGMSFGSVKASLNKYNGNKATEERKGSSGNNNRTEFNNRYTTIVPNASLGQSGQKTHSLNYHESSYRSDINFGSGALYGYSGQEVPINGTYDQYLIRANTLNAYDGYLNKIKTPLQVREEALDEIENLNLGVERREQPDLSVMKDIYYATVQINGARHIYNYGDRYKNEYYGNSESNGHSMEPKVKFDVGSKYGSVSYTRELYPSDVYYYKDGEVNPTKEGQLRVQVTYKIAIFNGANARQERKKITSIVNELEDYYDTKYEADKTKINIGRNFDSNTGEITDKIDNDVIDANGMNGYFKLKIKNMNMAIEQGKEKYVYVQLEVQQDKIHEIVEQNQGKKDDQAVKLDNIVEITSYSTKDIYGKTYAGIDKDSQPGNLRVGTKTTYEDDTDKAPGLKLVLQEERKADGQVFVDKELLDRNFTDPTIVNSGQIRQGDGTYDPQKEAYLNGVTVQLYDLERNDIARIWDKNVHQWKDAQMQTTGQGNFVFEGFIPERYKIVYIWGGKMYELDQEKIFRVQNYKATIYNERQREKDVDWYRHKPNERYSDAMDREETRTKIDDQASYINYDNWQTIDQYTGKMRTINNSGMETKTDEIIQKMDSWTPEFIVHVEYADTLNRYASDGKKEHITHLQNIDFGIIERAKQSLKLEKEIVNLTVKLSNGSILIDANIQDGKIVNGGVKHTIALPKINSNNGIQKRQADNGQVKIEIDNEILQGSRMEIKYRLRVENISELDYNNFEYYHYGSNQGYNINSHKNELNKLRTDTVIDYLDNKVSNNAEEETHYWHTYKNEEKTNLFVGDESNPKWGILADSLKETVKRTNTIMYTEKLKEKELQLTEGKNIAQIDMYTYKVLPSQLKEEDTIVRNNAEIVRITKDWGSTPTVSPGNYVPEESLEAIKEVDETKSQDIIIVPPTGVSTDYIAYTLLAISSLGILITGIILIKRMVLR